MSNPIEQLAADARAKAQRFQQMRAGVEQVTMTETSPDGAVTVTVDASGAVRDLRLTDQIRQQPSAAVAAAIMATMRRAQSRLADRVSEVMQETIGDDPATMNVVLTNYRHRFPEPDPEPEPAQQPTEGGILRSAATPPAAPPAPAPARGPQRVRPTERDDDDFDSGSVMRRDEDF